MCIWEPGKQNRVGEQREEGEKPASKPGPSDYTRLLRRTTPVLLKDRRQRRHISRDRLRIRECFIYLRRDFVGPGVIHRHGGIWHPAQQVCRRQLGHFARVRDVETWPCVLEVIIGSQVFRAGGLGLRGYRCLWLVLAWRDVGGSVTAY